MNTYKINGEEIEFDLPDGNYEKGIKEIFFALTNLLEALDEKKEEPKPEYYDHSKTKMYLVRENGTVDKFTEPKSTLREDIKEILCEAMYLKPEYLDPTGNKDTDKIISLFKDTLLKEMKKYSNIGLVTNEDIEEIIKNL